MGTIVGIVLILCLLLVESIGYCSGIIPNTFLIRIGGADFSAGDETSLAKYDILLARRDYYNDIGGDSWGAIKAINPLSEIYIYIMAHQVNDGHDAYNVIDLNNPGRWDVDRGHSMGDTNTDHPEFFLLDSGSDRINEEGSTHSWLLDFGSANFRIYSAEVINTDIFSQLWDADGVYLDGPSSIIGGVSATPTSYSTNSLWSSASNGYVNYLTAYAHGLSKKLSVNRGNTRIADGQTSWAALDSLATPPDALLEEGAFVVNWGDGDAQYYPESEWKLQVDVLGATANSTAMYYSHVGLTSTADSGTDNYGDAFTFWDALYYAMASFMLGRNEVANNAYFSMDYKAATSNIDEYYDEYDGIVLGSALSAYTIRDIGGVNIYQREFEHGYVLVNPNDAVVADISIPHTVKILTHANFQDDQSTITNTSTVTLGKHRAAILQKNETKGVMGCSFSGSIQ